MVNESKQKTLIEQLKYNTQEYIKDIKGKPSKVKEFVIVRKDDSNTTKNK